jgi:chromate transporter
VSPAPAPTAAPALQTRSPRSPGELFTAFTRLALQGFGGVLPVAQREIVERQRWLKREEFLELLSVGQVLPGPNVVNLALMIGDRFFGWRGAAAAVAGILCAPFLLVMALAVAHGSLVGAHPAVGGALRGMSAVAAGLLISMALKLAPALRREPVGLPMAGCVAACAALGVGVMHWPLVWVVLVAGGVSVGWALWRSGKNGT